MINPQFYCPRSYASAAAAARIEMAVVPNDKPDNVNYRKLPLLGENRFNSFRWPLPNAYSSSNGISAWPHAGDGDHLWNGPVKATLAPLRPSPPSFMSFPTEKTQPERRRASAHATFGALAGRGGYGHGYYGYGCSRFGPYFGALLEAFRHALGYGPQKTAQEIVGILEEIERTRDLNDWYGSLLKDRNLTREKAVQRTRISKRCVRLLEYTQ
ncbi:hypothetical protein EW145_g3371 [Phellinidium pouzarii]|uniref:Uncharacterized protein n=1 Tax=Phellinidium pouzarii TaxID=167371 RepID=A0A4S4L8V4_9AGAM|nr:hypothetical protein EW145_g3371 [Phellinidium pouzarii]